VALALELARRGHDVQIAAPVQFEAMIAGRGLGFAPLPGEFLDLMATPEGKAATVHQGGAGTTAASLRAGKPAAICPFFGDQPLWGRRVAALGVGPQPLDRKALSSESLATAIMAMDDPQMRRRSAALGALIQEENGVTAAAGFIETKAVLR
jgi:UDP:flavonoid glycosyltransferase YjiC (YdhE family)